MEQQALDRRSHDRLAIGAIGKGRHGHDHRAGKCYRGKRNQNAASAHLALRTAARLYAQTIPKPAQKTDCDLLPASFISLCRCQLFLTLSLQKPQYAIYVSFLFRVFKFDGDIQQHRT